MLYVNRPFAVGDQIELPSWKLAGTVRGIGLFSSELLTPDGEVLSVPNGLFTHAPVVNPSRRPHRRLLLEVAVELEGRENAEAMVEELSAWLARHPQVKPELPQRVIWSGVSDGALLLHVEVGLSADADTFHTLRQALLLEVRDQLARRGGQLATGR
jgi:small-conductance mechanosensitive channel